MADNSRDPDALQREIDRTRDDLARTIDEIVDRVHPKRVVQRRVEIFRENAQHFRETAGAKISLDGGRRSGAGLRALARGGPSSGASSGASSGDGTADEGYLGTTTYAVRRAKVPMIAGAGALLVFTAAVVVWRLRRR